ncbi:hypothetical protein BAE44_0025067 [Dichanthelium oligosanthes]|uniref:Uncharacterized protein n=1 Tax=Dichanthelium oligosanthes TaxID=888268 RepID=A0A1E5UM10_9POAL|nr:hypothetical protein BAE44_0025067 [Dichanthelium oligosanthes]
MDSIKKIDAGLYGGTRAFPRLEQFYIDDMECLEEWNTAYSSDEDCPPVFPCLRYVGIRDCPRLRIKQCLPPSIDDLRVYSSDNIISSCQNTGLARCCLEVECCVLPLIRWSLLFNFPFLEKLARNCSDLTCSPPDFLQGLTSLRTLTVTGCQSIVSLPERLGDLTSLKILDIRDCMRIKSLPDSIQKLTGLERLAIRGCPELIQWCKSRKNEMKLPHIKNMVCALTISIVFLFVISAWDLFYGAYLRGFIYLA